MSKLAKSQRESKSNRLSVGYVRGESEVDQSDKSSQAAGEVQAVTSLDHGVLKVLDELVVTQLFGNRPWPPKNKGVAAVLEVLERFKLLARDKCGSWQTTPLGGQYKVDLVMAFSGVMADADIYVTLHDHKLMHDKDDDLWGNIQDDAGKSRRALKMQVRDAYFRFYNRLPRQVAQFPLVMQAFAADNQRQLDDKYF